MISIIIISSISLILDVILSNFLPFLPGSLSIFTTLFTVVSVFLIYPLFMGNNKKYFIYIFIYGIVYDLMLTNLFLYHGFIFLLLGILTFYIYKNLEITFIRNIIYLIIFVVIYESLNVLFILIFNLVPVSFDKLLYKMIIKRIYGLKSQVNLTPLKDKRRQK